MLNNLSDGLRQAWRDGNWDMLAGQYFSEFDRNVHVVEPFPLPEPIGNAFGPLTMDWTVWPVFGWQLMNMEPILFIVSMRNRTKLYRKGQAIF